MLTPPVPPTAPIPKAHPNSDTLTGNGKKSKDQCETWKKSSFWGGYGHFMTCSFCAAVRLLMVG